MRIIAGNKRRLRLRVPAGQEVRPTADRIKETLFNIIQDEVRGSYFLDLFAGTGQIGLEAVSRNARYAVFVEQDRQAAECIRSNIALTKSGQETFFLQKHVISALRFLEGKYQFDIIFMDPPYKSRLEKDVLLYLKDSSLLKEDTLIIVEAAIKTDFSYLNELGYTVVRDKKYKTSRHVFLKAGRNNGEGEEEKGDLSGEL